VSYENLVRLTCTSECARDEACGIASEARAIDDLVDDGWHVWSFTGEDGGHRVSCPSCTTDEAARYDLGPGYTDAAKKLRDMRRSCAIEVNAEAEDQEGKAYIFLAPDPDHWVGIHIHGMYGHFETEISWEGLVELTSAMARIIETHRPEDFKRLRGVG